MSCVCMRDKARQYSVCGSARQCRVYVCMVGLVSIV